MIRQNIDNNMSKIANVLEKKLLPAAKWFGVGTKPVREAAKVCLSHCIFRG